MDLIIVTPIRLLGDGLVACLRGEAGFAISSVVANVALLREALAGRVADIALIDVTQGVELDHVRALASDFPQVALVALGLLEQRQDIIRCGRAGFVGYVERDASVDQLLRALCDAAAGRLTCSADVSGGLLRALFERDDHRQSEPFLEALTRREGEVLQLIGQGHSNKEIATELSISIATVKHHVHHILTKLKLVRRAQAMRRVREEPWIATSTLARRSNSSRRATL